jgi:photosystem II PsbW protein
MNAARTVSAVRAPACVARRAVKVCAVAKPDRLAQAKTVLKKELPKIEAAVVVGAATLTASPAFALVDKRLNGDGTRLPFGINDPILGWILVSVFGAVWAVFSQSTSSLGGGEEDGDDGGLSL